MLEPDPIPGWTIGQSDNRIKTRYHLPKTGVTHMDLTIIGRIDIKTGTAIGGKPNCIHFVWILRTVFLKGDTLQTVLGKCLGLVGRRGPIVGQWCRLHNLQGIQYEGTSIQQANRYHF